jgi:hypothetical protein
LKTCWRSLRDPPLETRRLVGLAALAWHVAGLGGGKPCVLRPLAEHLWRDGFADFARKIMAEHRIDCQPEPRVSAMFWRMSTSQRKPQRQLKWLSSPHLSAAKVGHFHKHPVWQNNRRAAFANFGAATG